MDKFYEIILHDFYKKYNRMPNNYEELYQFIINE